MQTNLENANKKHVSVWLVWWMGKQDARITKKKAFGNDEYVYSLDCGNSLIGVYLCQNLENCAF